MEEAACIIDDLGPLPVVRPAAVSELVHTVCSAAANGEAIYPLGGRTMLDFGLPPTKPGVAVDLRGLDQVIDYPARDMTITVKAGITISRLQKLLATENQRLPIDVPRPEQATLGGALATNASGPRRYGYGTLRDYLIGISIVNDEGHEVKAGGRVVKNVAGYDLMKLHIGALGTLGIITQVTLKLRPRPQALRLLLVRCSPLSMETLFDSLHRGRARPACLDLLNPAAIQALNGSGLELILDSAPAAGNSWMCVVGLEENQVAVAWQVQQLVEHDLPADVRKGAVEVQERHAESLWRALADFQLWPDVQLTFKANLLPSATAAFCRTADAFGEPLLLQAHAGNGIVLGHVVDDLTLDHAAAMLNTLRDAAVAAKGNLVLLRCPTAWKRTLPVWGSPRGDVSLMRAVKERLDPKRIFNPGRFVDGI